MFLDYGGDKRFVVKVTSIQVLALIEMTLKSQSGYILKVGAIS